MSKNTSNTIDQELIQEEKKSSQQPASASVDIKAYAKSAPLSFNKKNYWLLLIGLGVNILGYILMLGGATDDPAKFDGDALFSTTRITIAPILIVLGFAVILYAIMRKPKTDA